MGKKNKKNQKNHKEKSKKPNVFTLPKETQKWIWGVIIFIIAVILSLSFFNLAGVAGKTIISSLTFLIGNAVFLIPLILILGGLVFLKTRYEKFLGPAILATFILIAGLSGMLASFYPGQKSGGWLGYVFSFPFLKLFGILVSKVIFGGVILVGTLIFWYLFQQPKVEKKTSLMVAEAPKKEGFLKKIFAPKFKVKEIEPHTKEILGRSEPKIKEAFPELKTKPIGALGSEYKTPPLELLETEKGKPLAGDTVTNSAIIKKTLENFGLSVEMSEINIGPTVTQYALKPADGIYLPKITALSSNLSLALASHPIRIEAPIPGKSLVGIEVPNRARIQVRLRDLIQASAFQNASSNLTLVLGKDVSGNPCYADLARMPHLLVAGATGTGKTIFLNSLILSLLYQNSPEILRFILIDPKRVEFTAYKDLPHLLSPVIFDAQKTVNALKWLGSEMERRFEVLSGNGSRDIASFNEKILRQGEEPLPYIVLIIDELADLMVARSREVEVGIVRLAQMARAVGIHLVVATQRPSVEVITGLIKANITSRITFQVASQVDSRTVFDMAGAEKLLGSGDLLFISAEVAKPKRIQGAYISEKEVKRVVEYIKAQNVKPTMESSTGAILLENHLAQELKRSLEGSEAATERFFESGGDSLYEEAKRTVIEARKASASLLQRRLRIGYARAARLIDMLEEKGMVGPGEGAKPREVYFSSKSEEQPTEEENDGWKKV